ncbi:MAG: extracellular solute-binding protein [Candidatus Cloacimonetes bacterium]|nr:extracellular solute-binding protein [Candidatus Cloacimonadota bacterium]
MKKLLIILAIFGLLVSACGEKQALRLATTTSTENSGLLDNLLPVFTQETGIKVEVIAVGTGKAIKLGENGDVDAILVHARAAEDKFVSDGFGVNRRDVMHNDFIIIGVVEDKAGIKEAKTAAEAMKLIAENKSDFISRGDDSGTHKKENQLWKAAQTVPEGKWYKEIGQGMGTVIMMANETKSYTLTDRGTYLAMADKIDLDILFQGDEELFNPYGIIAVNPDKHPKTNIKGANKFIEWLTGDKSQKMINNFRKNGKQLFYADAP